MQLLVVVMPTLLHAAGHAPPSPFPLVGHNNNDDDDNNNGDNTTAGEPVTRNRGVDGAPSTIGIKSTSVGGNPEPYADPRNRVVP